MNTREPKDDGLAVLTHYDRRGPICTTRYIEGHGYYWNHVGGTRRSGPFRTRDLATQDEIARSSKRA